MRRPGRPLVLAMLIPVAAAAAGFGLHARLAAAPTGGTSGTVSQPAINPAARSSAAFTWDGAGHVDLLFGGYGAHGNLADTWTWDGARWHELHPATTPPPLTGAAATYDPGMHRVVLVGRSQPRTPAGQIGTADFETWTWDGATWHREAAATLAEEEFFGVAMLAYDARSGHLLLAGPGRPPMLPPASIGQPPAMPTSEPLRTYEWHAGAWRLADTTAEVPLTPLAMAWDSATGRVRLLAAGPQLGDPCGRPGQPAPSPVPGVTCGPNNSYTTTCNPTTCPDGRQWTWDGSTWQGPTRTPYLGTPAMGTVVSNPIGPGLVHSNGALVWTWDGSSWSRQPGALRRALNSAAVAADPDRHTLVVFGGRGFDPNVSPPRSSLSNQTYTWDGTAWSLHGGSVTELPPPQMAQVPAAIAPSCAGGPAILPSKPVAATRQGDAVRLDVPLPAPVVQSNAAGSCSSGYAVTIQLTDAAGKPLGGNQVFDKTMATTESLLCTNWCASTPAYLDVQLRSGGGGITLLRVTPACTDRSKPPSLQLLPPATR